MIENLSFFITKTKQTQWKFPLRLFLLVLCFLSISFETHDRVNSNATAVIPEVSGEIHLTKGVTVFDSSNYTACEAINIKELAIVKETDKKT